MDVILREICELCIFDHYLKVTQDTIHYQKIFAKPFTFTLSAIFDPILCTFCRFSSPYTVSITAKCYLSKELSSGLSCILFSTFFGCEKNVSGTFVPLASSESLQFEKLCRGVIFMMVAVSWMFSSRSRF